MGKLKNLFNKKEKKIVTSADFVTNNLGPALNPSAAIIRVLLTHYKKGCSRRFLEHYTDILNIPEGIRRLRNKGLAISTTMHETTDKYGTKVKYGIYHILDFKQGVDFYTKLNVKNEK